MIKIKDLEPITVLLETLACELKLLNLWQAEQPSAVDLSSSAPFCCDTLAFEQWLQFIFIPKIRMMIDQQQLLPTKISITPMAEEAFKHLLVNVKPLFDIIQKIDECLTEKGK